MVTSHRGRRSGRAAGAAAATLPLAALFAALMFASCLPSASATCDPMTFKYQTTSYYHKGDCRRYYLFDVGAKCMTDWRTAKKVCAKWGLELAPVQAGPSMESATTLCADNGFTCWMDGGSSSSSASCHLMSQEGDVLKQGCNQKVRFMCRTKNTMCALSSKPPSPSPPPPSPPSPPSPPPPSPKPPSPPPYHRDPNCLYLTHKGYQYQLYTIDAKERKNYKAAEAFCKAKNKGEGWDLVPPSDIGGWEALTQLCAGNDYTCWCKKEDVGPWCPLIDADGKLQKQGCAQNVRLVCRKKL